MGVLKLPVVLFACPQPGQAVTKKDLTCPGNSKFQIPYSKQRGVLRTIFTCVSPFSPVFSKEETKKRAVSSDFVYPNFLPSLTNLDDYNNIKNMTVKAIEK